ncbi:hypothetical protein [Myxosarcina sp. GI1]|uniref:hypothetical protein n=1 Tax=Myxosarcina sp. GI1 TaxID=1541065 RepID=UPI00068FBDC9|nr:hypothetical protein [Myxosarcina sp. GI1]
MNITYCKSWFKAKKHPTDIWDKEKALEIHKIKKFYTVALGKLSNPKCFLEINMEELFIRVNFFDKYLRDYLSYSFQVKLKSF